MQKTLIKCALIGGVIVFAWALLSWSAIGWQMRCFKQFNNEQKVAQCIRDNAAEDGLYLLPDPYAKGLSSQQRAKQEDMMKNGPVAIVALKLKGMENMTLTFTISFFSQVVAAYIITWMLFKTKALSYGQKVGFVALVGVIVGLLGILPGWLWKGLPGEYVAYSMIDLVVAWTLAGLAIAKMVQNAPKR